MSGSHQNFNYAFLVVLLISCRFGSGFKCFQNPATAKVFETKAHFDGPAPTDKDCDTIGGTAPTKCYTRTSKSNTGHQKLGFGCGECLLGGDPETECKACTTESCNVIDKVATIKAFASCSSSSTSTPLEPVYCGTAAETCAIGEWVEGTDKSLKRFVGCKPNCDLQVKDKKNKDDAAATCVKCEGDACTKLPEVAPDASKTGPTPTPKSGGLAPTTPKAGQMTAGRGGSSTAMALTVAAFACVLRL